MKKKVITMAFAVLLFFLTACHDGNTVEKSAGEADESRTLTIWAWDESFNIKAADKAKEIYQKEHPDVEIHVVTMAQDDIIAKLNTSMASGSFEGAPDVVLIEDYRIQKYLKSYPGEFADLTEIADPDTFISCKTGMNRLNGRLYGIPFDSGVAALFYRADYIEQAGFNREDMKNLTWEEYIEIGKAVKEKTGKYMLTLDPLDLGQIRAMLQSAGSWYTDGEGKVNIKGNDTLKEAIIIYKELVESGISKQIADWNQFVEAFNSGEVVTVPSGSWVSPSIKMAEDQSGKWAVAEYPRVGVNPDSVNATSIGGAGWYVLRSGGREELAKNFLKETFATNAGLLNQLAEDINLVSSWKETSQIENYRKEIKFYGGQKIFEDFAKWSEQVPVVDYGINTYDIEKMMAEAIQQIMEGKDIESTLADCQERAEAEVTEVAARQ